MILWRRVRKRLYSILFLLDALVDSFDSSCIAISYHWYWTFCFDSCQWYWNWAYFLFPSALIWDRGRERRCWNHDLWSQELGYRLCVCQYSQYGVEVLRLGRHLQVYWIWWWRDHALYILYTSSWYWIVPSFVYIDSIYQVVFPLIQFKFYAAIRSLASEIVACLLYTYIKINQKRGTLDVPVYCFWMEEIVVDRHQYGSDSGTDHCHSICGWRRRRGSWRHEQCLLYYSEGIHSIESVHE